MRVKMRSVDGQFRLASGNERAHLRHQDDQCGLANIRGLATHVWASDEQELLPPGLEAKIVGNEVLAFLTQQLFDHRMAPADDEEFPGGVEFGARIAAIGGQFCERGENVQLCDGRGGMAQARGFGGHG